MSTSGISSIAVGGSSGISAGTPATHVATTGSHGRMEHLVQTLKGFSSSEVMMALMQSVHHVHHHHASGETAASAAVGLALGPQVTGSHTGYSAASAPSAGAGAQISVHA